MLMQSSIKLGRFRTSISMRYLRMKYEQNTKKILTFNWFGASE